MEQRARHRLERADVSRPAAAQRGLGVMGRLFRGRWKPGRGAAPPRTRQLHLRPGSGRRRAWHRAGLAALHRAATGIRRPGCARRRVRRIRPRLLQRAHREGTPQAARAPVPCLLQPGRIAPLPGKRTVPCATLPPMSIEAKWIIGTTLTTGLALAGRVLRRLVLSGIHQLHQDIRSLFTRSFLDALSGDGQGQAEPA